MSALLLLLACSGADPEDSAEDTQPPPPMEHLYSFAILADPHITANLDPQERLAAAVSWINENAADRGIELVWVVGDIGWGDGLPISRSLLDALEVPYVPVIGDNEIHFGDEQTFDDVFGPQFDTLAGSLDDWQRGAVEVFNPEHDRLSWFYNFSFTYGGLRWVGLDWCSRYDGILGELADVHDFEGGTLPFFASQIAPLEAGPEEDVLLFSHHPMHIGAFDEAEMAAITGLTGPVGGRIAGAWAGHLHLNATVDVDDAGYTAWVTDAVWDDLITVRVVEVHGNGISHEYVQELVVVE
ncbi:MAG: hypothetical protein H6739_15065 [Alphaproteobacteria bacterium]|nr:hypothetical protein [Alphaproteobacteria bacterium]